VTRNRLYALSFVAALLVTPLHTQADVVFSDSEFDDSDWELMVWELGDGGSVVAQRQASGGNPGSYRRVVDTLEDAPGSGERSRLAGFHVRLGASYNPQVEGAIDWIVYAEDSIMFSGHGQGQGTGLILLQDGNVYIPGGLFVNQNQWTTQTLSKLEETDFVRVLPNLDLDPTQNPDFSATGSTIEFGFSRTNSTCLGCLGYTIDAGIDNWSVSIVPIPERTGSVRDLQKISSTEGGFVGPLDDRDSFGVSTGCLGDLQGDGTIELAVGAYGDSDGGGPDRGAVWILSLHPDGTVAADRKISSTEGGFTGSLKDGDLFGYSLAPLGDHDGDGAADLAVGARDDEDGGPGRGAVWILFLNRDGSVKSHQKISSTEGGFPGALDDGDLFGRSIASLGDLDRDGIGDLAVGADMDDDGGVDRGAVWVLFLNRDGSVKSHQKISNTAGGFEGILDDLDYFGISMDSPGDLNGDGVTDLSVGAVGDQDGGLASGAVWTLFLNGATEGGLGELLGDVDWANYFGMSVASLGDLDQDSTVDLAVGAKFDDDGDVWRAGAVWILFLEPDGTVKSQQKISNTHGGFTGVLDAGDRFGTSAEAVGDVDGDGVMDLAVGANEDDDGGPGRGAVWLLFLDGPADSDGDGRTDSIDNCPAVWNPGQDDTDTNGIGDACQCGDVNLDGFTNVTDAMWAARGKVPSWVSGSDYHARCDVNGDRFCNVIDALMIARSLIDWIPEGQHCPAYQGH
jgi:hypothetical protein